MGVDLKRVRRGKKKLPPRVLVYGFDGIGKTSFAAGAPGAFIIDANKGSHELDVEAVDVSSWDDARSWIDAVIDGTVKLKNGERPKTLVLDSITDLEAMSHAKLFPNDTVTGYKGGYGKGDDVVVAEWRIVLAQLERAWQSGIGIVMVAHARVRKFEDPTGPGYERFEVACRPLLAGMLRQWVDHVLFVREGVGMVGKKDERAGVVTDGVRWMYTRRVPGYDAKARASLLFPERILLSWGEFQKALDNDGNRHELEATISEILSEIGDPELDKSVRAYIREYPAQIVEAHNRVSARLEDVRRKKSENGQQLEVING
jgi:hypothetical protein